MFPHNLTHTDRTKAEKNLDQAMTLLKKSMELLKEATQQIEKLQQHCESFKQENEKYRKALETIEAHAIQTPASKLRDKIAYTAHKALE